MRACFPGRPTGGFRDHQLAHVDNDGGLGPISLVTVGTPPRGGC